MIQPSWLNQKAILFVAGLIGVAHETLVGQVERPYLLILFGGMMGLPAFLTMDRRIMDRGSPTGEERRIDH